jgi:hypothetical protein
MINCIVRKNIGVSATLDRIRIWMAASALTSASTDNFGCAGGLLSGEGDLSGGLGSAALGVSKATPRVVFGITTINLGHF